ncbi:MFS transporter, partial [Candidatus Woesearchaeota archaeon]|nr:MFS transporter [Candidatus Woesearchaeota archaeon]
SGIGSLIFGKISDRKGMKSTLSFILLTWVIIFPLLAFATTLTQAAILCLIAGLFFGPVWGISRAMMVEYTPIGLEARSFSYYTLAERFATFIGPLVWSFILLNTAKSGNASYSYALLGMAALMLIGFFIVRQIESKSKAEAI